MTMKNVMMWSIVSMIAAGFIGGIVAGIAGLKLAVGIAVIFGMTAAVIVYALDEIACNKREKF